VPDDAFSRGYTRTSDYAAEFAEPRDFREGNVIASWHVQRGDVIAYSGDSGYSEAAHLHYQITRVATDEHLCPTAEEGFADGGWLFR
jgi:hypothetical protein